MMTGEVYDFVDVGHELSEPTILPSGTFWSQTSSLTRKCLILLKRSWFWSLFRSFIFPVAFIVFLVSFEIYCDNIDSTK
jgi:hypothetical protein